MDALLSSFGNILVPPLVFFLLGFGAKLLRSDLSIPSHFVKYLSIYLLIGIGLHGGSELKALNLQSVVVPGLVAIFASMMIPLIAFWILHKPLCLDRANSVAIAAHYGSVSIGTFVSAIAYLEAMGLHYEAQPSFMLVLMEAPAIVVAILLSSHRHEGQTLGKASVKAMTQGSVVLLMGGLLIGALLSQSRLATITPFYQQMFQGILTLFMLGVGLEAAEKITDFKKVGLKLSMFGIVLPITMGTLGLMVAGHFLHFSQGGAVLVAVLFASASYIAVPPAIKIAIPEANPSLYLTLAMGVTFPFNVIFGIPLYLWLATKILS